PRVVDDLDLDVLRKQTCDQRPDQRLQHSVVLLPLAVEVHEDEYDSDSHGALPRAEGKNKGFIVTALCFRSLPTVPPTSRAVSRRNWGSRSFPRLSASGKSPSWTASKSTMTRSTGGCRKRRSFPPRRSLLPGSSSKRTNGSRPARTASFRFSSPHA